MSAANLVLAASLVLAACRGGGDGASAPGGAPDGTPPGSSLPPTAPTLPGVVTVAGNQFLRDGVPWVPHAVQLVAFVAPRKYRAGPFLAAYQHYSPSEFTAVRQWGADSVRLQLSQPGADPGTEEAPNPKYDPAFVDEFVDAVRAARTAGLSVIVSIQDESQSGEDPPTATLPNDATNRVWAKLAPRLNGDNGIVYEMFNEPQPPPSADNWTQWSIAMNAVIATIRGTGATNTLIADGLNFAETLDGFVPVDDPLRQVGYSSHPYFHNETDQQVDAWMRKFGNAAKQVPVIVGEWTSATTYYCTSDTPDAALNLLKYLESNRIGLVAVTYDFGLPNYGGIVSDYVGTPTTFADNRRCVDAGFGPGTLVQRWYLSGSVPGHLQ